MASNLSRMPWLIPEPLEPGKRSSNDECWLVPLGTWVYQMIVLNTSRVLNLKRPELKSISTRNRIFVELAKILASLWFPILRDDFLPGPSG